MKKNALLTLCMICFLALPQIVFAQRMKKDNPMLMSTSTNRLLITSYYGFITTAVVGGTVPVLQGLSVVAGVEALSFLINGLGILLAVDDEKTAVKTTLYMQYGGTFTLAASMLANVSGNYQNALPQHEVAAAAFGLDRESFNDIALFYHVDSSELSAFSKVLRSKKVRDVLSHDENLENAVTYASNLNSAILTSIFESNAMPSTSSFLSGQIQIAKDRLTSHL
jgi:hypothetical protein